MKNVWLAILGAIVTWFVLSIFTQDLELNYLGPLIIGIVIGYGIGKRENAPKH
ncbi:tRNA U-34 5-methylaminomethyl-2-thiouridine biosynthesis protein [Bacillus sp. J37]|uniref:tRNA U-34 5-methylaminomethyl-2-thiouridine biosynthesis protein n=1 Tax=Bacillus sp. J37 TaxID=935837 RepID=UPI0004B22410|nr:tRNA U-34 5-methylaminomethyl-2-thiouridine biosynthesis protein [Bacillus sp. J37]